MTATYSPPQHCPNCGYTHGWNTLSTSALTFSANAASWPPVDRELEEQRAKFAATNAEYARIVRTRALAIDRRRRQPSRPQARERTAPGPCTRAHQRLLGGRQSYARVRCDRKRAVLRARRAGR